MASIDDRRPTCPSCGETADTPTARFCENCGRSFGAVTAPAPKGCRCAEPRPDEDGFCQECGVRVGTARPPSSSVPDYEESVDASLSVASDRGRRHPTNQDNGAVGRRVDGTSLLVVCDGVSTSVNAEAASRTAGAAAMDAFLWGAAASPGMSLEEQARACVAASASAVAGMAGAADDPDGGPATTIVLAVARGRVAAVAWAGDSRAYVVTPGVPEEQVTRDDSWCRQVVDAGRMSYEAALLDPNAHAITQWLGMPAGDLEVHARTVPIPPAASLVLCSDGLWNYADGPGRLGRAYAQAATDGDNRETCRRLVAFANEAGGRDNVTVAILTPD